MSYRLTTLHDPYDRRLCLIVAVGSYALVRLLILLLRLLKLDLIDLDAQLRVLKIHVEREVISRVDFSAFR